MDLSLDFKQTSNQDKIRVKDKGIVLYDSAYTKLSSLLSNSNKILRITLEPSGCAGVSYKAMLDEQQPQDEIIDFGDNVRLLISAKKRFPADNDPNILYSDYDFLEGLHLRYEESIMNSQFVMDNPNAERGCSCGISFKPRGYGGKPKSCH